MPCVRYKVARRRRFRRGIANAITGASLADMMVGLTVGLVVMAVVLQTGVLFDARRKAVSGMADAHMEGSLALQALTRELRMAGHGLGPPDAFSCALTRATGNALGPAMPLQPLLITQGAGNAPDRLELLASAKPQSLPPARLLVPYVQGDAGLTVDSPLEVSPGDWLMLQQAGLARCLLLRAQNIPIGAFRIEPVALPADALPAGGYAAGSALVNLGALYRLRFSIGADDSLQLAQFDIASGNWSSSPLVSGIVNLQAQYGFDARAGLQATPSVNWWSDTLIDADHNGVVGDIGDWQRILAVRVALVLRSAQRKEGPCDTRAPSWFAGDTRTGQLLPVSLSIGTAHQANCYRYRVLDAEIPLRNLLWSDA